MIKCLSIYFKNEMEEESQVSESLLAQEREEPSQRRAAASPAPAAVISHVDISLTSHLDSGLRQRIESAIVAVGEETVMHRDSLGDGGGRPSDDWRPEGSPVAGPSGLQSQRPPLLSEKRQSSHLRYSEVSITVLCL